MFYVLLLLAISPPSHPKIDFVDRVEVNHVYSDAGELVFDQICWWAWSLDDDRFHVVDWRLLRGVRSGDPDGEMKWALTHPDGPPYVAEWIGGHATPRRERCGWVSEWYDEKSRKWRRVVATTCIESAFCVDIELNERLILPESRRRGLSR